jgi:hypothetical protein
MQGRDGFCHRWILFVDDHLFSGMVCCINGHSVHAESFAVFKVSKLNTENQELKESLACMQTKLTDVETTSQFLEDECVSFSRAILIINIYYDNRAHGAKGKNQNTIDNGISLPTMLSICMRPTHQHQ